jgi:hypothetical protein
MEDDFDRFLPWIKKALEEEWFTWKISDIFLFEKNNSKEELLKEPETIYYNGDCFPIKKVWDTYFKYVKWNFEETILDHDTFEDLVEIDKNIWDKLVLDHDEILQNDRLIMQEIEWALYPEEIEKRFLWLIEQFKNKETILKALDFVKEKHEWQYRKENTPYWAHCTLTAIYTIENGWSEEDAIVALLHDTVEDQYYDWLLEEIEELFWKSVLDKVLILSKERKWERISDEEYYEWINNNESCSRIKWADRLSNVYWLFYGENKVWNMKYLKKTINDIIPLIKDKFPDLVLKIEEWMDFITKNWTIDDKIKQRIEDLWKIRDLKKEI